MARYGLRLTLLLVTGLALASGLTACGGSSDDDPPLATTEAPAPLAVPVEPPAPATPESASETSQPSITPIEAPIPEPPADPDEPGPPTAAPPTDDPTATASEEAPAPVPETTPLLYDTYDLSGAVSEPGHYAFLADPDDPTSVVTTYEGLRDGTATALLIHTHDAHGVSQADLYDAVESGDLFEWRQAADCFVRYQVTEVKADPTGTAPQKLLGVAWMTYAFTGCSGAVDTTTAATLDWGDLPDLGGTSLTVPVIHGTFQIVPALWTGAEQPYEFVAPPAYNRDIPYVSTSDLATARQFPYWRDPVLPDGWSFALASNDPEATVYGYQATYLTPGDGIGLLLSGKHMVGIQWPYDATWTPNVGQQGAVETRVIAGRPARIHYDPSGADPLFPINLLIYDPATHSVYTLVPLSGSLRGANVDAVIAIAASLFEE